VHHLSRNPTPWTAYAFHPLESVVQALGLVLIFFIIPLHPTATADFHTISTAINVYGHLGYELYPRGWAQHPLGTGSILRVAHNTHHDQAHYTTTALFPVLGSRGMGTLVPSYETKVPRKVRGLASRTRSVKSPKLSINQDLLQNLVWRAIRTALRESRSIYIDFFISEPS